MKIIRTASALLIILGLTAASQPGRAAAQQIDPPPGNSTAARLQADASGLAEVRPDPASGLARFISIPPAQAIPTRSPGASLSTESAADEFVARYAALFGVASPATELAVERVSQSEAGRFVRYQQHRGGIPVLNGELIVQMDLRGRLLSINGRVFTKESPALVPTLSPAEAAAVAISAASKYYGYTAEELSAAQPELVIYNPALINSRSDGPARLVWKLAVTGKMLLPLNELFLVDALSGAIRLHFSQLDTALNRKVYNANNTNVLDSSLARSEGNGPTGDTDVDLAYTYAGDTYTFYSGTHGRNSIDNAGMTIISTTHYCLSPENCPYLNAFWSGSQMVYGEGLASADDVVAHELTHGVTQYESNLLYLVQSGAINESFSDIWGEFVDQTNMKGNDGIEVKWLMGEDLPSSIGVIRNMKNPPDFGDPDRMGSPYYKCNLNDGDGGGVHSNSGVLNKAAYLMVDGGSFNGKTISGIGIAKTAKVLYQVQTNLLPSGGEYSDLYNLIPQACSSLIGSSGITAADCGEVNKVILATEMNQEPAACATPQVATTCPAGTSLLTVFKDDFESGRGAWEDVVYTDYYGASRWLWSDVYAHSGTHHILADGSDVTSSSVSSIYNASLTGIAQKQGLALSNPYASSYYLNFAQFIEFDSGFSSYFDGGVLEYSTDNGANWLATDSLPVQNGPESVIISGFGNPLEGRLAFSGYSVGILGTQFDISSLAGQTVRFRFLMGLDYSKWSDWVIDDFRVLACVNFPYDVNLPQIKR